MTSCFFNSCFSNSARAAAVNIFSVALILVISGCGDGSSGGESTVDNLGGMVQVDGSSTVYPLTEAVAEEFMKVNPRVRVTVGVSGTGGGFSKFLRGETDINDASRPIKPTEAELGRENGIEYVELPVAFDGLAVISSPENDWAECLTVGELDEIWKAGSTVNNWSQVRAGFPDRELRLYGAGTDSGTYDYFTAAITGEEGASRGDFTASEDDNVLVQGMAGDANALGFLPYAYYSENMDKLKLLGVDDGNPENGDGCIQPSTETVQAGTYQPLARPEFIYVNTKALDRPEVMAFVDFYLNNATELATEVGYVGLSAEAYGLGMERARQRVSGSVFEGGGSKVGVRLEDLLKLEQ